MNKTYIFIFFVLLFTSCWEKDEYHHIPDDAKPIYKLHDTLIYQSNKGVIDTFYISSNIHYFDVIDKKAYYERILLNIKAVNIKKYPLDDIGGVRIETTGLVLGWFGSNFDVYSLDEQEYKDEVINGKTFEKVYHFLPSIPFDYTDSIMGVYYNPQYCIVKYETKSGLIWELINY